MPPEGDSDRFDSAQAWLLRYDIPFRFVHDIAELLTALQNHAVILPTEVRKAASLTEYAVMARYPGPAEPVTEEEYREALRLATIVVEWVESQL